MTATLRYFRPLDAPRSCFLWEAIMWVAFGRFPESGEDIRDIYFDSDDEAEVGTVTFNWREHIFQQEYRFGGFSQSEIEAAGLNENSVDWAYYERALALTGYVRLELLTEEIARHRSLPERNENQDLALGWKRSPFAGEFETIPKERADRELKILEAHRDAVTPYIDSVHAGFQHHIDNAWAKIFQSLVNKSISAVGWRLLGQDEIRELASSRQGWPRVINLWDIPLPAANSTGPLAAMAVKEEMPVSDWSLSGIAPDAHFRSATGRFWWAVTLPTDKLFRLFPRPLINANLDKFHIEHLTPDVAISVVLDDTNDRHPARSGPGKPKKANGAIERACHELFGKRLAAGEKELALASHAAKFVQKVWGEKLSRTTFQEYMKAFRPQKSKGSANVPEIMPENSGK